MLKTERRIGRAILIAVMFGLQLMAGGCEQKMAEQPHYRPLEPSPAFKDGQSARAPVAGTVARGTVRESAFYRASAGEPLSLGDSSSGRAGGQALGNPSSATAVGATPINANAPAIPVTRELLEHGRERFGIYCSVCHGLTGYGDGMVAQRGFLQPPSLHDDRRRQLTNQQIFDVISKGFGAMPSYGVQTTAADRWAIVAYVRALQLSQNAAPQDMPADELSKLQKGNSQ